MSDVTFIGLGKMGAALAEVLLKSGRRTSVWNRNAARCGALADKGVVVSRRIAQQLSENRGRHHHVPVR